MKPRRIAAAGVFVAVTAACASVAAARPSHDRAWQPPQSVLPQVTVVDDTLVHVRNVRTFTYRAPDDYTPAYDDRTYNLNRLTRVWYVIAPFSRDWRGPAHSFVSFEFADSQFMAISVEARRRVGQEYSIVKGLLRRYELMYVIGDERDLIGLRAVTWDDPVYLYPMRATPAQARGVLLGMLERARQIEARPEFYNTLTNNCTTNILDAVNAIATTRIPYGREIFLPGYSDALAHELGLIDTELTLDEARERFVINARAQAAADAPDFSHRIRG